MKDNKTRPTSAPVSKYINAIENTSQQSDSLRLIQIMSEVTKEEPVMWGPSIVGFGSYHYKYDSGRQGDSLKVGFAARKQTLTIYGLVMYDTTHANNKLLEKLGPHKTGKGCLYIKKLSDIDETVLRQMIANGYNTK